MAKVATGDLDRLDMEKWKMGKSNNEREVMERNEKEKEMRMNQKNQKAMETLNKSKSLIIP